MFVVYDSEMTQGVIFSSAAKCVCGDGLLSPAVTATSALNVLTSLNAFPACVGLLNAQVTKEDSIS